MKKLIENYLDLNALNNSVLSEIGVKGHIKSLHTWWARRPLSASISILFSSLIDNDKENLATQLASFKNIFNKDLITKARQTIKEAYNNQTPKVIDPFSGGGTHPLASLILGCDTYANDYNPVSVLINKAIIEFPKKYGQDLIDKLSYWASYVYDNVYKELSKFYKYSENIVGFIWANTIPCQNPLCSVEIPLMTQYWLANKKGRKISLYPKFNSNTNSIDFDIIANNDDNYKPWIEGFDPDKGSVSKSKVCCLACGNIIDDKTTRKLFQDNKSSERLIAVIYTKPNSSGKYYRLANDEDIKILNEVSEYLNKKNDELRNLWFIEPIPDEDTPTKDNDVRPANYGMKKWGDLFNIRQKLCLVTFTEYIKKAYEEMIKLNYPSDFAKAITTYLSFILSKLCDKNARLIRHIPTSETISNVFAMHVMPMIWDYVELNPFSDVGFENILENIKSIIKELSNIQNFNDKLPVVTNLSATNLEQNQNNYFDFVFIGPPYYSNISYAMLSDFFYVWHKRILGDLYNDLFITPLAPKKDEIIAERNRHGGSKKAKEFFEENLTLAFKESYRILKPNGIIVIVYTHKSTSGWETIINALLDSGFVVNASWPIKTESSTRLRALNSAALASSIYIVARKIEQKDIGFYEKLKDELKKYMNEKLDMLWQEGISGADFFVSAIGIGIEIFGKYKKIISYSGDVIRADKILDNIREVVTNYVLNKMLKSDIADKISKLAQFYILYRWEYGASKIIFDEARKLATSLGINLDENIKGFIKKEKEYIYLVGPEDRIIDEIKESDELIDVLHYVLRLWEEGRNNEIIKVLNKTGYGQREEFYLVANAIVQVLPTNKEKKLLEGFLTSKETLLKKIKEDRYEQGELM